ncbi:methyl-accepting chemotaxis protein [Fulvimarina manganoxydans]|uniref:Methyl-accepting chemotaxis protein n=1 Tax=Fulvimarina manganoxydans TaxID=937218 RepID=A0A1W2AWF8_9HYPH|nr:methyl-accepting chemotaxis protein [Fulvimarina manganoxydans]SMC65026.1 methyl-accepting chemotaxis protein [Fulvimarina manganoxydans]
MPRATMSLSSKVAAIVVVSLLTLTVALMAVTAFSLENSAEQQATERQEANMRVAWDVLRQYGSDFSVTDGRFLADGQTLNDFYEAVDRVKDLVGGTATIFMGDTRVTTNVMKPDGSRAVGTKLAKGPVYDAVLGRGEPFRGEADILGTAYYTAYDPIKNAAGETVGILYVGVKKSEFFAHVNALEWKIFLVSVVLLTLIVLTSLFVSRRMFASLKGLAGAMDRLGEGDTSVDVPGTRRGDDIGAMARSVEALRQAALRKEQAEAEARTAQGAVDAERTTASERQSQAMAAQDLVVGEIGRGLTRLANGDLTTSIETTFPGAYESLRLDFNRAVTSLNQAMSAISSVTGSIQTGTLEIRASSDDLARRTEQQAASLEETAAALSEINEAVTRSSGGAEHARNLAGNAKSRAEKSSEVVAEAVAAMGEIENSSGQISQIITVIDEIAFQTNLLALNAGVEAARAGESGRGFAVVAQEVRALAQRSAEAAKEIKDLINTSTEQVDRGVELVGRTGSALDEIMREVVAINDAIQTISASAAEQATSIGEVNVAVSSMDQVTQQNAAMVEQATAASHRLGDEANRLSDLVSTFEMGAAGSGAKKDAARKAAMAA